MPHALHLLLIRLEHAIVLHEVIGVLLLKDALSILRVHIALYSVLSLCIMAVTNYHVVKLRGIYHKVVYLAWIIIMVADPFSFHKLYKY